MIAGKDGQKTIIANQTLIIGPLGRIEALSQQQSVSLSSLTVTITDTVVSGLNTIVTELKSQTQLLGLIFKRLGGKEPKPKKKETADGFSSKNIAEIVSNQKVKDSLTDLAKVLVILGAGFFAFGKGLGEMKAISKEQVMTFGVVFLGLFATISLIYKKGYYISVWQAMSLGIVMVALAIAIKSTANVLTSMPTVSPMQMLTTVAIAGVLGTVSYYLIKSMTQMYDSPGFMGFIGDIIKAPIIAISSMGALIILPMLALVISSTA